MRIRSSSPPTLSLAPLPPTPAPSATTPVSPVELKREPTPFDELPMSHLISFPIMDSPTSADPVDAANPFESFHNLQHPYSSYQSSSALIRDAFDYYRLPNNGPSPISDALDMSIHGTALKPQLHAHTLPDLTSALYSAPAHQPQQEQQQQQQCISTSHLFSTSALTPAQPPEPPLPTLDDDGTAIIHTFPLVTSDTPSSLFSSCCFALSILATQKAASARRNLDQGLCTTRCQRPLQARSPPCQKPCSGLPQSPAEA